MPESPETILDTIPSVMFFCPLATESQNNCVAFIGLEGSRPTLSNQFIWSIGRVRLDRSKPET